MATIASLLGDHATLRVRSVDRIFLHGYVPKLMTQGTGHSVPARSGVPDPLPGTVREDRQAVHRGDRPVRAQSRAPRRALRQ
jgi:hypothetical protein